MNAVNAKLDDGGVFTLRMTCYYLIHSQHTIATSQAKFNATTHISVDISYTWNVCNLTLPLANHSRLVSENFFAGLGVTEFYVTMWPGTKHTGFVSLSFNLLYMPINIKQPLQH